MFCCFKVASFETFLLCFHAGNMINLFILFVSFVFLNFFIKSVIFLKYPILAQVMFRERNGLTAVLAVLESTTRKEQAEVLASENYRKKKILNGHFILETILQDEKAEYF